MRGGEKKRTLSKDIEIISEEWDSICRKREFAIENGLDPSLKFVTVPCILEEVEEYRPDSILDVGCGTGYLTSRLSQFAKTIGIDCSRKSIEIAKDKYINNNLQFIQSRIGDYCSSNTFDICVSNMVFSCDPNWRESLSNIYKLLKNNGYLIFIIPHPCFWPYYWEISDEDWFTYNEELFVEHNFSTTFMKSMGTATYIHRPLENYINTCVETGFYIEKIKEPYPIGKVPSDYSYEYPRFLMIKVRKRL